MNSEILYHPAQIDFEKPGKRHYRLAFHLDSGWGYSLLPITVINGLRQPARGIKTPGVAAFGGTHGNEWEGQIAVQRLANELQAEEIAGRVILLPQLSPSACAANQRRSPLDNVNMNRAFPGAADGTISYRIAHFVKMFVFPQARVIIDLHAGGREGGFALCTSIHQVHSPEQFDEMVELASLFQAPFIFVYSSDMASGLLTDEAEADGKIALGGEFGFGESVSHKGVLHAAEGIRNVLRHCGMLEGAIAPIGARQPGDSRLVEARQLEDYVACPRDGIWEPTVQLGEQVRADQQIGFLHDFSEPAAEPLEIRARRDGFVMMMCGTALCRAGTTLYVIAREVAEKQQSGAS